MSDPLHKDGDIVAERYDIQSFIDEGGMQQVFRAFDATLERDVALKTPKNASAGRRFQRSCIVSAQVNHPNVAKTLDYLVHDGTEYLVEELVEGENLRVFSSRFHTIDPFLCAHIVHHLSKGLSASHAAGVFHRDLKPSNVIVSASPWPHTIKITDFGIAKMAGEELTTAIELGIEHSITTSATLVGALPYMAREFIESPDTADKPADVWSFGAILYQLMSGVPPFGTGFNAVKNITSGNPPAKPHLQSSNPQFESSVEELWSIVEACFAPDPADRPTAQDLVTRCGQLCYSAQERTYGEITRYGHAEGAYGFIRPDHCEREVFFHRDSFYGPKPESGMRVSFASYDGGGAPRAFPVLPMK